MNRIGPIVRELASILIAVDFDIDQSVALAAKALDKRWRWLRPMVRRLRSKFAEGPRPSLRKVSEHLAADAGFLRASNIYDLRLRCVATLPATMRPISKARDWELLPLHTEASLAKWLGLSMGQLDWFADTKRWEAKRSAGRLRHYHYRVLHKRFGRVRLIEAPKPRLKAIQRRILNEILNDAPPHDAVHGFRRRRSIKSFASAHVGCQVVLRMDLENFFPSIRAAQVQALFRSLGYPERVAGGLTGLCTNSAPADVWRDLPRSTPALFEAAMSQYARAHLPQGAPTSPAVANLCAYRLDCRLAGLAESAGASYTRYADDLAFSGNAPFVRSVKRFSTWVCATVMEEGFAVNFRKTRIMRQGVRQQLAGLVVNHHVNVTRREYDRLKATLTNCLRVGPQNQNRDGVANFRNHLEGRVAFVEMINARRGARLRELFTQIDWAH